MVSPGERESGWVSSRERERANGWVNSREKSQHMGGVLLEVVQVDSLDRREVK